MNNCTTCADCERANCKMNYYSVFREKKPASSGKRPEKSKRENTTTYRIGDYQFYPKDNLLTASDGEKVRLRKREKQLLEFLCNSSGKPVHRSVLLSKVWGYVPTVETQTLEKHVYTLRRKINHDRVRNRLLIRKRNCYRLVV